MKILKWLYTAYGLFFFSLIFLLLFPLLLIPIIFPKQYHLIGVFNRWWAKLVFSFMLMPWRVEHHGKLDHKKQYVFCPNHFSYLDIPTMGLNMHNTLFVGKSEMENIPLFGFMYRKLHITVDRAKLMSRYSTMLKSMEAIDEGKSLVIFPEGGIITLKDPIMARFKDGAFRTAIEKQIAIVPVTIPHNWIILPPDKFLLSWGKIKLIFHEPIETVGLTLKDLETLKQKVFTIIHEELKKQL